MRHHHHPFHSHVTGRDAAPRFFWFGRGRHDHGHGHPGDRSSPGGRGRGDDDFMRGRRFGSEDLQLLILALLADGPRHGYELIKLLDTRSKGFYVPSPGMVYPALTYLEEIGHATVRVEGNRKSYALSAEGEAHLQAHREHADLLLSKLSYYGKRMEMVRQAFSEEQSPDGGPVSSALRELLTARRNLKARLADSHEASPEQQSKIVAILEDATAQIAKILRRKPS